MPMDIVGEALGGATGWGLASTEGKLKRLLDTFQFSAAQDLLRELQSKITSQFTYACRVNGEGRRI